MTNYSYRFNNDYDKQLNVGAKCLRCYSKEKLSELYPEGDYSIVGEMKCVAKKADEQKNKKKKKRTPIGQTDIENTIFEVFSFGTFGSFFNKDIGYVCVGEDKFLIVKQTRVPFIAAFSPMVLSIAACAVVILLLLLKQTDFQDDGTYHPLPSVDPNIEVIEPDVTTTVGGGGPSTPVDPPATTKVSGGTDIPVDPSITTTAGGGPDVPVDPIDPAVTTAASSDSNTPTQNTPENGGGAVSIIYTMTASYKEGDDEITVYFKNPKKSNHDMVLELYAIATDGSRVLMAKSGRIPIGYGIEKMTLLDSAPDLTKNNYKGLYRVTFYDPKTGELATVDTEIPDINITVK